MIGRRKFIKKGTLSAMAAWLGMPVVFGAQMPAGYVPLFIEQGDPLAGLGKNKEMIVLGDRPWNIETPAHLLDDAITPADKMFIRNNGTMPTAIDPSAWQLLVDGESVVKSKTYSLADLKSGFKHYTYQLTMECGGNGRSEFNPPAKGNQWTVGAVSCAQWTGIRLRDVLNDVGITNKAVYIGYYGTDIHLSGDTSSPVISRGVPIAKAMQEETLLAFAMNGKDIPLAHGHPLRLVAGGWPASVSGKWINRIAVRNIVHDGPKMQGNSYRVPCKPVAPGTELDPSEMCIIESMPVKSVITYPMSGALVKPAQQFTVRGHAWAGELEVKQMDFSIDYGATWKPCQLQKPANRLAWQHWSAQVSLQDKGYYELWVRATDSRGRMQPMVVPGWNPSGYINNACHRIAFKVV